MWALLVSVALAAPPDLGREPDRVISLGAALVGVVGVDGSGGGLGQATVMVHLPPLSIELLGAEGVLAGDLREVGAIGVGIRKHLVAGTWARLLFVHHHEAAWGDFLRHPGGVLAGVDSAIHHRSGLDVGFGWSKPVGGPRLHDRLVVDLGLSVRIFPGTLAPPVYVGLQLGILGRVGPQWPRRQRPADEAPADEPASP